MKGWIGRTKERNHIRWWMLQMVFVIVIIMNCFATKTAYGQENDMQDISYHEIQGVIDDILEREESFDFASYVGKLMAGEEPFSFSGIASKVIGSLKTEITANMNTFGRLITIAIIAALFTNLSMSFKNNQVSETGYYVTYLLLFGLLISTFVGASVIATTVIRRVLDFMKALVPTYFLAVGFTTGSATSILFYQSALIIISFVDLVIVRIIIPLINFYLLITLANNLSKEDMLSRLAALLETSIKWLLKSLLGAVVGYQAIQGLIVPVTDQVKRSVFFKASESIPVIGNTLGSVTETVLGAGVLLKNAIGVAGLVVLITICVIPLIKLLVISFIHKGASAVLQPISDKRIIECIGASAKAAEMLIYAVFVGTVLFLLSITIVAVSTGGVR